ncbi:MAG: UDP-3-O-(3-hydroxymyristoyl)glucosamine N-acyltransferase [Prolixibacteraceae bacterium]
MEFTAHQLATLLGGEVVGDMDVIVNNVSKIEKGIPGTLTFLANPKYNAYIYETKASIVLVNRSFQSEKVIVPTLIRVDDAYASMAQLLELYVKSKPVKTGIEIPSFIASSAQVGNDTYVGAFSYLGENVKIGNNVQIHPQCWIGYNSVIEDNTVLFAGVKIYPETKIGANCILHSGVVIGSDGFGFAPQEDGTYSKIQQIGNVVIEDNVEIGANTTVDCATMGSTILHKGVKLDNLVQIGHNVEVGDNTVMAAFAGVSGSTSIGKNCVLAGQAGVVGHIRLGDKVTIGPKAGVSKNVPDGKTLMGEWGVDYSKYMRVQAVFRNLPEISNDVKLLKKEVNKLKAE